ncbi:hypothetical protein RBH29_13790 [Herbivorax sp. ANBcel31]|uniref:hypothetical protein n=1 Tax=Herbivorax sp. ANBcel31 TaxID=3069754 RepID=UPI0027B127C3|nr:hypothetical protein [Herbivorax sp. ANBcel31]MDQ2087499.1 hypothetical protein [Herbivorax sp. ANBcel31]
MLKKLTGFFLFAVLVMGFCFNTYANEGTEIPKGNVAEGSLDEEYFEDKENDLLKDNETQDTEQFLVAITRPESDESTFRQSYIVCGNSEAEGITVKLFMYNEESDSFEPFENIEGESSWEIGISGFFVKEIELPNVGANKMRIVAFRKDNEEEELILGENLQINTFTVTLLDDEVKDSMRKGFFNINQMLMKIFGS